MCVLASASQFPTARDPIEGLSTSPTEKRKGAPKTLLDKHTN
jgi:hypothetical protein